MKNITKIMKKYMLDIGKKMKFKDNCAVCVHCKHMICINNNTDNYKKHVSEDFICEYYDHWSKFYPFF